MGRALQYVALDAIRTHSPSLSERLHGGTNEAKPYLVSGLHKPGGTYALRGHVAEGDPAWVRIVGLGDEIVEALEVFVERRPTTIEIDHQDWYVESLSSSPREQPWADRNNYDDLFRGWLTARPPKSIRLQFATPTAFHSKSLAVPLPIPSLIFGSLLSRWNSFAPAPLSPSLTLFIDQFVEVRHCNIQTYSVTLSDGSQHSGFTGEVDFSIVPSNPGLKKRDEQLAQEMRTGHTEYARMLGLLADFAFYSGIGIKTAQGMGMVRAIAVE